MLRPLAKSGLDLAGRVRTSAWASSGREPAKTVGCILSRSWSQAFRGLRPRRPSIPIRFSLRPPVLEDRRRPEAWIPPDARYDPEDRPLRRVGEPGRSA